MVYVTMSALQPYRVQQVELVSQGNVECNVTMSNAQLKASPVSTISVSRPVRYVVLTLNVVYTS